MENKEELFSGECGHLNRRLFPGFLKPIHVVSIDTASDKTRAPGARARGPDSRCCVHLGPWALAPGRDLR